MGLGNSLQTAQAGGAASVGGWVELARTTLGSAGTTIDVSSLPDKRYLMILEDMQKPVNARPNGRFNSDTGSNYSGSYNINGGANTGYTSATSVYHEATGTSLDSFQVSYVSNLSSKEKLHFIHSVAQNTAGAGTAPDREENTAKWANTANAIDAVNIYSHDANFDSGSEVVVLGWDPADTHTTNFWEELASVQLGSAGDTLSSGTITAKKYLWVQYYTKNSGNVETKCRFNSDSGSNYAFRWNEDGGGDTAYTSQTECDRWIFASKPSFHNFFIVNNTSNEKLITGHVMSPNTAGAGTAPARAEFTSKWANTSSQITDITVNNTGSGDMDTGSIIKVWGSD